MSKTIKPKKLHEKLKAKDKKCICIDVRTEGEHDTERIPNTINIPVDQLRTHIPELKKYNEIYLHCTSGNRSNMACETLSGYGFDNQYSLEGGISSWKAENLPTIGSNKNRIPIMRQVMIVAAIIVLTGLILKVLFNNDIFLLLPTLIGFGFLYSGFSGNCLMTKLLLKAAWNQHKD